MLRMFNFLANRIFSLLKILAVFLIALCTPRFFMLYAPAGKSNSYSRLMPDNFRLGLENISDSFIYFLQTGKDGQPFDLCLVTNASGLDQERSFNLDVLLKKGLNIKSVLLSEKNIKSKKFFENKNKLPIKNIDEKSIKKLNEKELNEIDAFVFDIQNNGLNYDDNLILLRNLMRLASDYNKSIVILDRPNPLGECMEGPVSQNKESISLPLRHGMTIGEISRYFNRYELSKPIPLYIVSMRGYNRNHSISDCLPVFISSGLLNINSCYCYSFLKILFEAKPVDIGLCTNKAFQCIGLSEKYDLPISKWYELRNILRLNNLNSEICRYWDQEKNERFIGISMQIYNMNDVLILPLIIEILQFLRDSGIEISFSKSFDKLVGSSLIRQYITGKILKNELTYQVNSGLEIFYKKAKEFFISDYYPTPKVITL